MEKYFATFNQALDLKDIGFKEPCFGEWRQWDGGYPWLQLYQDLDGCSIDNLNYQYTSEALAPLKSQVFEWFRKEYGYWSYIKEATKGTNRFYIEKFDVKFFNSEIYESYEESEFACINKLIELVVNKQI